MSKRGRRVRQPRGPHKDKYATKAAQSQTARAALDASWAKDHPTPAATTEVPEETSEGEAVA